VIIGKKLILFKRASCLAARQGRLWFFGEWMRVGRYVKSHYGPSYGWTGCRPGGSSSYK